MFWNFQTHFDFAQDNVIPSGVEESNLNRYRKKTTNVTNNENIATKTFVVVLF